MNNEKHLTVAEAAVYLNVSTKTVRRLIDRGDLAAFRVGRQLRISPAALHAYQKRTAVMPRPAKLPEVANWKQEFSIITYREPAA